MNWISVNDSLPNEIEEVLVTDGEDYAVGYWRDDAQAWDSFNFGWIERNPNYDDDTRLQKVTHWMRFDKFAK